MGQFLGLAPPDAPSSRSRRASSSSRRFSWRSLSSSSRTVTLLAMAPLPAVGFGACVGSRSGKGAKGRGQSNGGEGSGGVGRGFFIPARGSVGREGDARRRHRRRRRRTMTTRYTRMPPRHRRRTRPYRTLRRWRSAQARREREREREREVGIRSSRTGCRSRPAPRWRSRSGPGAARGEGTWARQRMRGDGSGQSQTGEVERVRAGQPVRGDITRSTRSGSKRNNLDQDRRNAESEGAGAALSRTWNGLGSARSSKGLSAMVASVSSG